MLRGISTSSGGGGGGGVSGSGTANYLAKWTAGTAVGNSIIQDNGNRALLTGASGANSGWYASDSTRLAYLLSSAASSGLPAVGTDTAHDFTFVTGATEQMRLTVAGRLGIGLTNPSTLLHVAGATTFGGNLTSTAAQTWTLAASQASALNVQSGLLNFDTTSTGQLKTSGNFATGATSAGTGKVIGSLTLTNGGTGYTNGTYSQVALTGGTGTGATADIVVAGGIVTSAVLRNPGQGYTALDSLSCASIGAGSNFAVQVATVASILRSDGTVVAPRIGAGTTTPVFGVDSTAGIAARSGALYNQLSFGTSVTAGLSHFVVDSSAESGGITVTPANVTVYGARIQPRFDLSANTSGGSAYGVFGAPIIEQVAGAGTAVFRGVSGGPRFGSAAITGKTFSAYAFEANISTTAPLGASNTFSAAIGFRSLSSVTATNAQTFTGWIEFEGGSSFSGAAHAITSYFGLRLYGPTLSGGATVTNRWGISQEDAAANNVLAGNTVMGAAAGTVPTAPLDVRGNGTVTGNLSFNSGYGSAAVAYGTRAWVNFNGATGAIRASGNVSSVTRASTGKYTVNFTNAMPDANYAFKICSSSAQAFLLTSATGGSDPSTSASVYSTTDSTGTSVDPTFVSVVITR